MRLLPKHRRPEVDEDSWQSSAGEDSRPHSQASVGRSNSRSRGQRTSKSEEERARDILTRQLAMMDRSRFQLAQALATRGIPDEVAEAALTHFTELGLIDDAHFAEVLVRTRLAEKHASRRAIVVELRCKGVAADIIEEAISHISEEEEFANAVALAMKKLRIASGKADTLERRVWAALERRGFSHSICARAMAEAKERIATGADGVASASWAPSST